VANSTDRASAKGGRQHDPSYEGEPTASERRLFFVSLFGLAVIACAIVAMSIWR
jgi:hypothetical protein